MNILDADVACYSLPALKSFVPHTNTHTHTYEGGMISPCPKYENATFVII